MTLRMAKLLDLVNEFFYIIVFEPTLIQVKSERAHSFIVQSDDDVSNT